VDNAQAVRSVAVPATTSIELVGGDGQRARNPLPRQMVVAQIALIEAR